MKTPFKVIDLHTHILPEHWPDLKDRYGYGGWVQLDHHKPCCARMMIDGKSFREIQSNSWDPSVRISECERDGVHMQVLSTVPVMFAYWAKPDDAYDLARILNDHIAGVVADFPDRFIGLGTVPMQHPELACRELERVVKELKMPGIQIGSHVQGMNLDDPAIFPVLEAARDLGASVFVHPWDMLGSNRMKDYWMPWLVGMPAETAVAICSIVMGGILDRLPGLKIAFAHGGGSFPFTLGRIAHGHDVRPDLCAHRTEKSPREYLDHFYLDSLVHDADALRFLVNQHGSHRIALGSDYPFPLGETQPGSLIRSMNDLTEVQQNQLLGGTALEFLGMAEAEPSEIQAGDGRSSR